MTTKKEKIKKKTPKKSTPKKKKTPVKNTITVTLDDFEMKMLEELSNHLKSEQILKMGLANVYFQFKRSPINIPTVCTDYYNYQIPNNTSNISTVPSS